MSEKNIELRKSIYSARTVAYWSFVGVAIPIAGWIIGSIALSRANALDVDEIGKFLKAFNAKTINIAKTGLIITTMIFFVGGLVGGIIGYSIYQQMKQPNIEAPTQAIETGRDKCLNEAAKLRVDVRDQLPDEDLMDYYNYRSEINSKEIEARTDCFNRYGYPN